MQITSAQFLRLAEQCKQLAFFDIEASGLAADYGQLLCAVIIPYGGRPEIFRVERPGDDKRTVEAFARRLEQFDCWVSYNGKLYDIKFVNTRLVAHGLRPLKKRHHLDLYWIAKSKLRTSRKSQLQILSLLGTAEQKMGVSPNVWSTVAAQPKKNLRVLAARCASDCKGLIQMYERLKLLIENITM